jgi:hypothetical protein
VLFLLAEETEREKPETRLCPDCLAQGLTPETADYLGSPSRKNPADDLASSAPLPERACGLA